MELGTQHMCVALKQFLFIDIMFVVWDEEHRIYWWHVNIDSRELPEQVLTAIGDAKWH